MTDTPPPGSTSSRRAAAIALLAVILLLAGGLAWWSTRDRGTSPDEPPVPAADADVVEPSAPPRADGGPSSPGGDPVVPPVAGPFAVEGRVVDSAGHGVGEVTLEIIGPDGVVATVESELDGGFRTGGLPLELYTVRARAAGHADAIVTEVVPGGPPVTLTMQGGSAVVVQVRPVGATDVVCHLGGAGLFPAQRVEADASGRCRFDGLPDGTWQVVATARDAGSAFEDITIDGDGQTAAPVLELGPASELTVEVAGEVFGIEGALVTVARKPLHVLAFHEVTGPSGTASFPGLRPGVWWVSVRAPGFLPTMPRAIRLPRDEIHIVEPERGVTISGTVVDPAGVPVPLASIVARVETADGATWLVERDNLDTLNRLVRSGATMARTRTSFSTNAQGRFTVGGLPPGHIALEARKDGWVPERGVRLELLDAAQSATDVRLEMSRGGSLAGRLVGAGGGGLGGGLVRWRRPGDDVWGWREAVPTDGAGAFELSGVPERVELEASAPGYGTRRLEIDRAPPAGRAGHEIALEPMAGRVVGRVLGREGAVVGAVVRRVDGRVDPLSCLSESDLEGRFELLGCPAVGTTVEVSGPNMAPSYARVEPGGELEVEAGRGAVVRGAARTLDGGPIAEATLTLESSLPILGSDRRHAFVRAHTFGSGGFELGYVPAGRYELRVEAAGHAPWSATRVLEEGATLDLETLELAPLGRVEGTVLDAVGSPLADARVWAVGTSVETVTDASGRWVMEGLPAGAREIAAVHWLVGRDRGSARVEPGSTARLELRLDQALDAGDAQDWPSALASVGIVVEREERGWIVSEVAIDSLWSDHGIERGDFVERVQWRGGEVVRLGVVRDGHRQWLGAH